MILRNFLAIGALLVSGIHASAEPIAGRIWDVGENAFISTPELIQKLTTTDYIFIGERHGRVAHQNRSAFIIGALAEQGHTPSIVLEMLTHEQTPIVEDYRRNSPEYALTLAIELDWADSGWPAWSYYYPIFNMAFTTKADIIGGDLTDDEQDAATQIEIPTDERFLYYAEQMLNAHCGLIDDTRVKELARMQIARDLSMARALSATSRSNSAILIAGSSHIGKNLGVPSHLTGTKSVLLLRETETTIEAFLAQPTLELSQSINSFDYIWFTPKIDEDSICDKLQ